MRQILIIAMNTFREIIRDRILYGIVVFALLLIGVSVVLGELTFVEHARISANFGFTGIQIASCVLAVFAGSTLVAREIDKQTVLTLLAKPVSRTQFLLGKYLGLSLVLISVMCGLGLVLAGLVAFLELKVGATFVIALFGILLEALILIALALFFGTFSRPVMTIIFSASLFLIGHWVDSLDYFIKKSNSTAFKSAGTFVAKTMPNFEKFNWRSAPIYDLQVPASEVLASTGYAIGWILVLMTVTSIIFRRRDFV